MAHMHSVYDTDKHFTIDPATRALVNQTPEKAGIMQYDHDSERITFDLPAVVEGHRILDCNRVEVHYLNIDAKTQEQRAGLYEVDDLQISPADDKVAICSWLISMSATQLVGPLYFRVTFKCVTEGNIDYSWSTAVYKGLTVSDGINCTEYLPEQYADFLTKWLDELGDAAVDAALEGLEEAKEEIQADCNNYLAEELAKRSQLAPEFANSIEECTDTTKLYVLPDGYIYAYMYVNAGGFVNQIPLAIDSDGAPYNGGQGWKTGYRLNSSGAEKEEATFEVTGFIPVKLGDTVYLENVGWNVNANSGADTGVEYVWAYDSDFNYIGYNLASGYANMGADKYVVDAYGNLTQFTVNNDFFYAIAQGSLFDVAYVRLCCPYISNESIIAINEKIGGDEEVVSGYYWKNTGHAFVPADYESRIIALEKAVKGDLAVYGIVDSENNIFMSGSLEKGTYALKYQNADGTTTDIGTFTME